MALSVHHITLGTGVRTPYVDRGDRGSVPILCLHGVTDSWRSFEGVLPHLPSSRRALALSLRGHGDADRPEKGYGPEDFAGDVRSFLDALDIEQAIVVGHSMGSYVAQRFALDHPGRTAGLVLMGSFTTLRHNTEVQALWDAALSTLEDPLDPVFVREFQESTLARHVPIALIEMVVAESLKVPARVWRESFAGLLASDHAAELKTLRVPTLVAWGDCDGFASRAEQDALVATIPGAQLLVYPGGGHGFHWEDPEGVARDLERFAERVERRGAGVRRRVPA